MFKQFYKVFFVFSAVFAISSCMAMTHHQPQSNLYDFSATDFSFSEKNEYGKMCKASSQTTLEINENLNAGLNYQLFNNDNFQYVNDFPTLMNEYRIEMSMNNCSKDFTQWFQDHEKTYLLNNNS